MEQIKGVPSYPKTGKRGVPQQFPRRLFNMLESESQLQQTAENLISWSESGKAFRIEDVTLFSTTVLPKYFRTCKFSSFQRNLNLYGFSKVRRGPDADMYAHPSFLRGSPEILTDLKKCKSAADRKKKVKPLSNKSSPQSLPSSEQTREQEILPATSAGRLHNNTRAVSPSSSSDEDTYTNKIRTISKTASRQCFEHQSHQRSHFNAIDSYTPLAILSHSFAHHIPSNKSKSQPTGKLDLLTLAITCLDDAQKSSA